MLSKDQLPKYRGKYEGLPSGLYLGLFHGSEGLTRPDMDDFGFDGPVIGPLKYVHTTYCSDVKYEFDVSEPDKHLDYGIDDEGHFEIVDDCVKFNGDLYGDWTVFNINIKINQ